MITILASIVAFMVDVLVGGIGVLVMTGQLFEEDYDPYVD